MRKIIIISTMVLASLGAKAQQDPQFTQFMYNQFLFNPAYAGSHDLLRMNLFHRDQWTSMPNRPVTQSFTLNSPLDAEEHNVGIGLSVINEKWGMISQTSASIAGSYHIKIKDETYTKWDYKHLYMGLNFGMKQFGINSAALDPSETGDVALPTSNLTALTPDVGFGLLFKTDGYYIGLSAPHLLESKIAFINGTEASIARHFYFTAGYTLASEKTFSLTPNVLVRATQTGILQTDFNLTAKYMELFWIGGSYRNQDAIGVIAGFNLGELSPEMSEKKKRIMLGFGYEVPISDIQSYSTGSYEIMFSYDISLEKERGAKFGGGSRR